jgi:hypothetical protein
MYTGLLYAALGRRGAAVVATAFESVVAGVSAFALVALVGLAAVPEALPASPFGARLRGVFASGLT